ncbi:hypothetical protein JCM11491_002012 [Sporobolomyces phaffii]
MATGNRWAARGKGSFVARDNLSLEQQQILAAVPRWKKEWVRPSNLQPGQNPNYKIYKWVIDTSADKSSGTAEEMEAAVEQVQAGNVPNVDGTVSSTGDAPGGAATQPGSNGSTPAPPAPAPPPQVPTSTLSASTNPMKDVMQTGSAQSGGVTAQSVQDAVKPLQGVPAEGLIGGGGATEQKDKSLMEE